MDRRTIGLCQHFQDKRSNFMFYLCAIWILTSDLLLHLMSKPRVAFETFLEFMSQGWRSDILSKKHSSTFNFWPLYNPMGSFQSPVFQMLNDARVVSACFYARTCQKPETAKQLHLYTTSRSTSASTWQMCHSGATINAFWLEFLLSLSGAV